jgi:hypothetical protein
MGVRGLLIALLVVGCGSGVEPSDGELEMVQGEAPALSTAEPAAASSLGDGFVVWESNRSGEWRLWTRRLDGSGLRRLTADEPGRSHCCPHVSPDGSRIAYLSFGQLGREYSGPMETGELRVLDLVSGEERSLGSRARTYFEHRAVVWRTFEELLFIDAEGSTRLLNVDSGESRLLLREPAAQYGWLIDATLRWSVSGRSLFGRYDSERQVVVPGPGRSGCQPYFTSDGRLGFWMAAPGGPIEAVELGSGRTRTIVRKSDDRLPSELGYLYFPMYSSDRRLLAFAASAGEHDHFRSDYEIFAAPTDPETLELIGLPVRLTSNPATDRYPDVFLEPLPLGRIAGEAPFTIRLDPGDSDADWLWDFNDGTSAEASVGEHTFERPGLYRVSAARDDVVLRGLVSVASAAPPVVVAARLIGPGDGIRVDFDEPVEPGALQATLASAATTVDDWSLSDDGRTLRLGLTKRVTRADTLRIGGIVDRAQVPNRMEMTEIDLAPPLWPSSRDHLVFVWATGDAPNLVYDSTLEADRACVLEKRGRARLDRNFSMLLEGGAFMASSEDANRLRWALQATNEMTLEVTVTSIGDDGRIVSFSSGGSGENFHLEESEGDLLFGLRQGSRGPKAVERVGLASLIPGRPTHVVVTYAPGRLRAYVDGELVTSSDDLQSGFFHWRSYDLSFGDESSGGADWSGGLEGIAIYDRALDERVIRDNFTRIRQQVGSRVEPHRLVVEGRLRRISKIPTLAEISPYREALAVFEYEVVRIVEGEHERSVVRVADWAIADGERVEVLPVGESTRLVLEPFAEQPQLESVYLSDTLAAAADGPVLYYHVAE